MDEAIIAYKYDGHDLLALINYTNGSVYVCSGSVRTLMKKSGVDPRRRSWITNNGQSIVLTRASVYDALRRMDREVYFSYTSLRVRFIKIERVIENFRHNAIYVIDEYCKNRIKEKRAKIEDLKKSYDIISEWVD